MTSSSAVLHVTPGRHGAWLVTAEDQASPLSEHHDASAAVRAASSAVRERGGGEVFVHDRYHHVHPHRCDARD